jgi:tetratricopeptide (TPR) repeat protein
METPLSEWTTYVLILLATTAPCGYGAPPVAEPTRGESVEHKAAVWEQDRRWWLEHELGVSRRRVREQLEENECWARRAMAVERELVALGERSYERRDYRRARDFFRQALSITYPQWIFGERAVGSWASSSKVRLTGPSALAPAGAEPSTVVWNRREDVAYGEESVVPSKGKERRTLDTALTALARKRLAELDALVDEDDLLSMSRGADESMRRGRLKEAYTRYALVQERALQLRESSLAGLKAAEAADRRKEILALVTRPLVEAEKAFEDGDVAGAFAAVAKFRARYHPFDAEPFVRLRFERLFARPEILRERRNREASQLVELGRAALARKDYAAASRCFGAAAKRYPDTEPGDVAAAQRAALDNDPVVREAIRLRTARYTCQGLLARAQWLVEQGKPDDALAIYERIVREYPATPWADRADRAMDVVEAGADRT